VHREAAKNRPAERQASIKKRWRQAGKKEQRQTCKEANVCKEKVVKAREKKQTSIGGQGRAGQKEADRIKEGKAMQGRQIGKSRHS
jgi:hypothetical protein